MPVFLIVLSAFSIVSASYLLIVWLETKIVPMKKPLLFILICYLSQSAVWVTNNIGLEWPSSILEMAAMFLDIFVTLLLAQKGYKIKAVVSLMVFFAAQTLSSLVLFPVSIPFFRQLGIPLETVGDVRGMTNLVMSIFALLISTPVVLLVFRLLRRDLTFSGFSVWYLLLLPVPLSQVSLLYLSERLIPRAVDTQMTAIAVTLCAGLCIAADICFFFCVRRIRQAAMEREQLRWMHGQLDTQVQYYTRLRENILSVNRIRHDLNNQLQAAYRLMETGDTEQVRQQLERLGEDIRSQVGPRFSGNLMVDAVLSEKAGVCREKGIDLSISAEIPNDLAIENAHLCSVFSNLLDNAIQGAESSGAAAPWIRLHCTTQSSYLAVRCENAAAAGIRKNTGTDPLRRHGMGLEILRYLAGMYNGSLTLDSADGSFSAVILLQL